MAGGAPRMFESDEDLKKKIEEYFFFIQGEYEVVDYIDEMGQPGKKRVYTVEPESPSITGLALYLGFESRQSVYDYEKHGEFSYTIKRARLTVEKAYEQALLSKYSTGAIFALKNFGWSDKQEIDHTTKGQSLNDKADLSKLTDEELRIRAEIDRKSYGS